MAEAITAVAVKPDAADMKVVSLATSGLTESEPRVYFIITDASGSLTAEPMLLPESALSGVGSPDLEKATILFDASYNAIIALGHDDLRDFMTLLSYESGEKAHFIRHDYEKFQLSQGNDNGCSMTLPDNMTSKVYLAGR